MTSVVHQLILCGLILHLANQTHASGENAHPENHDSPFCAMNQGISHLGNNDNDPSNDPPGLRRYFDASPHFCDMSVNAIKNVSW